MDAPDDEPGVAPLTGREKLLFRSALALGCAVWVAVLALACAAARRLLIDP